MRRTESRREQVTLAPSFFMNFYNLMKVQLSLTSYTLLPVSQHVFSIVLQGIQRGGAGGLGPLDNYTGQA